MKLVYVCFVFILFIVHIYCQPWPPPKGLRPPPKWRDRPPTGPHLWAPRPPLLRLKPPKERFERFHKHFRRPYRPDSPEYHRRYQAFLENIKRIEALNKYRKYNASATYGVTKFSDLTPQEFKEKYLSGLHPRNQTHLLYQTASLPSKKVALGTVKLSENTLTYIASVSSSSSGLPLNVDWRDKGLVSPVQDQKGCGGCWAFSVGQMVESMAAIKSGKLTPLSIQEVIDCSNSYHNMLWGCRGGDTCNALLWLQKSRTKLVPTTQYPLTDSPEACQLQNKTTQGVSVLSYSCNNLVSHEEVIQQYVSQVGPVSVSVDATTWGNYLGGIIQYHCGEHYNNHAVVIVGYDKTGEIPYYIVKNSWGADFGDKGYVYIAMGGNVCGIAQEVSTAQVEI